MDRPGHCLRDGASRRHRPHIDGRSCRHLRGTRPFGPMDPPEGRTNTSRFRRSRSSACESALFPSRPDSGEVHQRLPAILSTCMRSDPRAPHPVCDTIGQAHHMSRATAHRAHTILEENPESHQQLRRRSCRIPRIPAADLGLRRPGCPFCCPTSSEGLHAACGATRIALGKGSSSISDRRTSSRP